MKTALDIKLPLLTSNEVTNALNDCRAAGASEAAEDLSKHIARLEVELLLVRQELEETFELGGDSLSQLGTPDLSGDVLNPWGIPAMNRKRFISHESALMSPPRAGLSELQKLRWRRRVRNWIFRLLRRPVIS